MKRTTTILLGAGFGLWLALLTGCGADKPKDPNEPTYSEKRWSEDNAKYDSSQSQIRVDTIYRATATIADAIDRNTAALDAQAAALKEQTDMLYRLLYALTSR